MPDALSKTSPIYLELVAGRAPEEKAEMVEGA